MRTITPKHANVVPPEAKKVFEGIIYDVYNWQQTMFDGSQVTFERLRRRDTVKVIAVKDDKIVFIKDEQPGREAEFALPGGRHDVESETELDCAKRELHEETGLTFGTFKLVDVYQPYDEIDWLIYIFVATNPTGSDAPHVDAGERIELHPMTVEEAQRVIGAFPSIRRTLQIVQKAGSLQALIDLPEYQS